MEKEFEVKLETDRLLIQLLTLSQMKLWANDIQMLERELDCKYDAEPVEDIFLNIINNQIETIEKEPEDYACHSFWFIIRKTDRTVVGSMVFKGIPNELKEIEIGYGLGNNYEHNGYMTEAIKAFCKMVLTNPQIKTIIAETEKDNIPSHRVLERCDFKMYKEEETMWWRLSNDLLQE